MNRKMSTNPMYEYDKTPDDIRLEKQLKKEEITIVESQFDNYFLYIASLLGNFKNSNREYDYLEVEFHGFEDGKRIDLEYKIELKDKSRYEIYTKMEQMMNSYFDPKENVESVLEFALDINGKKIISFEPIDDLIKPVMRGGKKIAKLTVDELAENNLINDKVAQAMDEKLSEIMETMSSVSHSSGKRFRKRKKLFGIL